MKWSGVISAKRAGGAIPALFIRMSRAKGHGERHFWLCERISEGPVGVDMSIRRWRTEGEWGRERMRVARAAARGVLVWCWWWRIILGVVLLEGWVGFVIVCCCLLLLFGRD